MASSYPITLVSFPKAILHIDADAFFASCEQSRNPKLKGKPIITGKERGIASSMSYEAKARGVTRGMRLSEIKKLCPDAILLPSDYETYSLLSKRMFDIVRRYTPVVEEYSIDECFADITGLRRVYRCSYVEIAEKIKLELDTELGFTFSLGIAPSKVLAKLGSKWKKPSGLTAIPGRHIHSYLSKLDIEKVWGIGAQTTAFLNKLGVRTALEYAKKDEGFIKQNLSKPFYEIWQELKGISVYPVTPEEKETYQSVQKVKTFTPASNDKEFVFAQLSKNIENACIKVRKYKLMAQSVFFYLRRNDFQDFGLETKFSRPTNFPNEIITTLRPLYEKLFNPRFIYRSTGIALLKLKEDALPQMDLFGDSLRVENLKEVYIKVDEIRNKYGKHSVFLGSSLQANSHAQHAGERGELVERKTNLFKGETRRKKLNIPMFSGNVL